MALIEVKGYVNNPATKGSEKKFSTFTLAEKQLGRDKQPYKVFYNVADFNSATPPAESSFVTIKGFLNVRPFEKDGIKRQSLDITVKEIEVAPPRDAAPATGAATEDTNWDF